jgi:hypothetical protein
LFEKPVFKNTKDNLLPEKRNILNNFRAMPIDERNLVIRQQEKGNNFVFLDINLDEHKVKEQMARGSFEVLNDDPTLDTVKEIDEWVNRWKPHGLSDKWVRYITSNSRVHPGVNYPLIKTLNTFVHCSVVNYVHIISVIYKYYKNTCTSLVYDNKRMSKRLAVLESYIWRRGLIEYGRRNSSISRTV